MTGSAGLGPRGCATQIRVFITAGALLAVLAGCTKVAPDYNKGWKADTATEAEIERRDSAYPDYDRRVREWEAKTRPIVEGGNAVFGDAVCDDPRTTNPYLIHECLAKLGATPTPEGIAAQAAAKAAADQLASAQAAAKVAADQLAAVRAKRDAGKRLTSKEVALITKGDIDDAAAALAAQQAQAQAIIDQAKAVAQQQAAEIAYRQRLVACRAAADLAALSVRNFWGGIAAGLATGAVCMN